MKPKQFIHEKSEIVSYRIIGKKLLKKYGFSVNDILRGLYVWNECNNLMFEERKIPSLLIECAIGNSNNIGINFETKMPIIRLYLNKCFRNKYYLTCLVAHEFGHTLGFSHDVGKIMKSDIKDKEKTDQLVLKTYKLPYITFPSNGYREEHCEHCGEYIVDRNCKCGEY